MTTLLAIDQSITELGMCYFDGNKIYGTLLHPKKETLNLTQKQKKDPKNTWIKTFDMACQVNEIIDKLRPDEIYFEGYGGFGKSSTPMIHAELVGSIKYKLESLKISWQVVPILTWKKEILGKGNLKKNMIIKEVLKTFNVDVDSDNQADAYCILMYAIKVHQIKIKDYQCNPWCF